MTTRDPPPPPPATRLCLCDNLILIYNDWLHFRIAQMFEQAFSGVAERQENVVRAERMSTMYDFKSYYKVHAVELVGTTEVACFWISKDSVSGRTVLRTKKFSHDEEWEDDGTTTLFHVR